MSLNMILQELVDKFSRVMYSSKRLLMHIYHISGFDPMEPTGGRLKILVKGTFNRSDFQLYSHQFLMNRQRGFKDVMHSSSILVIVDAHHSKF